MKMNEDYIFEIDENNAYVKIISGEYLGTKYMYGKVSAHEDKDTKEGFLDFSFDIVETDLNKEMLEKDENFIKVVGDILVNVITEQMLRNKEYGEL